MLAPEEWHCGEFLAHPHHVDCRSLALTLRDHPMFEADALAGMRVGPACDVSCGIDTGSPRLEKGVPLNPAIRYEAGLFGKGQARTHPDSSYHKPSIERAAALERCALTIDRGDGVFEVKNDPMLLMQRSDKIAYVRSEDAFHRSLLGRYHVHLDVTRPQSRGDLKTNKARADNERTRRCLGCVDNAAAISE